MIQGCVECVARKLVSFLSKRISNVTQPGSNLFCGG